LIDRFHSTFSTPADHTQIYKHFQQFGIVHGIAYLKAATDTNPNFIRYVQHRTVNQFMAAADADDLENNKSFQEWKECNDKITKLDTILIDIRRYGFTVASGLMAAGSFLGLQTYTQFQPFQIVIIFATMALVDVLYWLDVYYQTILTAIILRTQVLEKNLSLGVNVYISRFYMRHKIGKALHILYIGFLVSLATIGGHIVYTNQLDIASHLHFHWWILFLSIPIIFVFSIWLFFDRNRYRTYSKAQAKISNFLRTSGTPPTDKTIDEEILKFLDSDKEDLGLDLRSNEWVHFDGSGRRRYIFWSKRLIVTNFNVYAIDSNPIRHTMETFEYNSFEYSWEPNEFGRDRGFFTVKPYYRYESYSFKIELSRHDCEKVSEIIDEIIRGTTNYTHR
jgi:hypothetical protein